MEVSGFGCCFSSISASLSSSSSSLVVRPRIKGYFRETKIEYRDNGHVEYYHHNNNNNNNNNRSGFVRCSGEKKKKKKLKLVRSLLSKDLSMFSHLGFDTDPLHHQSDQTNSVQMQEAAQGLMEHLHELRAKEKELKKRQKMKKKGEKKSKVIITSTKMMDGSSDSEKSSSSSSESSDSGDGEGMIHMSRLRGEAPFIVAQPMLPPPQPQPVLPNQQSNAMETNGFLANYNSTILEKQRQSSCVGPSTNSSSISCNDGNSLAATTSAKRIEVCMGGKCKKSGGAALLEKFQRVLGAEEEAAAAVVGCKCMGKCREGPNVRVMNSVDNRDDDDNDSVTTTPPNPLCFGVGLEDVHVIVANFVGKDDRRLGVAPAAS